MTQLHAGTPARHHYIANMHRLFVAIRLPSEIRMRLLSLMGGLAEARWQDDDQLHLTLRFIGDADRHRANDIAQSLSSIDFSPFSLSLASVGQFERKERIHTLWAGVRPHDALQRLHRKIDRVCVLAGCPSEERAYLPHITLARFGRNGGRVEGFISNHAALASPSFQINEFALFESHLTQGGAHYQVVATYPGTRPD